jgi:hypothetical protein
MLRRLTLSATSAAFGLLFSVVTAGAASDPAPPPGAVSVQPVSVSAGSSAQPGGTASAQTGHSDAYTSDGSAGAGHCGIQAGGGGTSYAADPNQIDTAGSSTAKQCSSSSTGTNTAPSSGTNTAGNSSALTTNSKSATTRGSGQTMPAGVPTSNLVKGSAVSGVAALGILLLLGLAILLAFFFFLLGALLGRRRQARTTA